MSAVISTSTPAVDLAAVKNTLLNQIAPAYIHQTSIQNGESTMKKSLIAAVFTIGLIGNAFAGCEEPIYNAPEELQPSCVEATATAPDAQTLSTKELQRKAAEDAAKVPDTDSASVRVSDESSQSRKR